MFNNNRTIPHKPTPTFLECPVSFPFFLPYYQFVSRWVEEGLLQTTVTEIEYMTRSVGEP